MSQPSSSDSSSSLEKAYLAIASDDEGRLCDDIPDAACDQQPQNFFLHVLSLTLTKLADAFVDPKLILSWLLTQIGAASGLVALLVPIREAGALLPQLFIARWVRQRAVRKWVWIIGSTTQGLAALAMVWSVSSLSGNQAAWAVLLSLGVLAIARSLCSLSYKDVLGKTVARSTRGTATGLASSLAATGTLLLAFILTMNLTQDIFFTLTMCLGIAGLFWLLGASSFSLIVELPGATEGGKNALDDFKQHLARMRQDPQLLRFLLVRGLYTATAFAPPFMLMLGQYDPQSVTSDGDSATANFLSALTTSDTFNQLGLLIFASAGASLLSSFIWGKLADRSSQQVLLYSGIVSAISLVTLVLIASFCSDLLHNLYTLPILLFVLMVSYQGVRLGRSVHLVDMTNDDNRAHFTAISNTVIGLVLLAGSVFGLIAQWFGSIWVVSIFAIMCLLGSWFCRSLKDVQQV